MNIAPKIAAASVALLALAGCASDLFEGKYAFSEGWRKATVLRVEQGSAVEDPRFWSCLRNVPVAATANRSYVVVAYHQTSRHRKHLVEAPPDMQLGPGDNVYVNLSRCDDAVVRRAIGAAERS